MKLYFESSKGRRKLLGRYKTEKGAVRRIYRFCEEHNFNVYYIRVTDYADERFKWYDVGSHSEFFYLYYEEDERENLNHL